MKRAAVQMRPADHVTSGGGADAPLDPRSMAAAQQTVAHRGS
jgi:hypothetical protein